MLENKRAIFKRWTKKCVVNQMDRTSILGDTIDYMRELLDKIHKLREEGVEAKVMEHQMQLRNPPKVYSIHILNSFSFQL